MADAVEDCWGLGTEGMRSAWRVLFEVERGGLGGLGGLNRVDNVGKSAVDAGYGMYSV